MNGVGTRLPVLADTFGSGGNVVAVNAKGLAAGWSSTTRSGKRAALWKNGKVIDLGALESQRGSHRTNSHATPGSTPTTARGANGSTYRLAHGIAVNNQGEILAGSSAFPHSSRSA